MRSKWGVFLLLCCLWWWVPGAKAYVLGDLQGKIDFREEIRVEAWSTFDRGSGDDSYTFGSSKMRLGFGFSGHLVEAYTQFHWTQFVGLPTKAVFGTGPLYYGQNNGAQDPGYAAIAQAWLRIKCPRVKGASIRLGRFVYNSGLEVLPGDPTLRWLTQKRISQRLIGGFEWSRVGRSFDGLQVVLDQHLWNITLTAVHPTAGGFYLRRDDPTLGGFSLHDVSILSMATTLKDTYIPGLEAQLFYYYYNDNRHLGADPEVHTLGGHVLYTRALGPGRVDLLFWGAYQSGVYAGLDHSAYGLALEGGYKLAEVAGQPWLRVGMWYGSGDDDPTDQDHNTFFMMIPTLRIYALTPWYNLMNTTYYFAQLILKPHAKVTLRSDLTRLYLTEKNDAWYLGSGITRPDSFGYSSKPSGNADELGTMWDLSLFLKDLYRFHGLKGGLNLYYSHVWGGDVVADSFPQDDSMDFFYAEAIITF